MLNNLQDPLIDASVANHGMSPIQTLMLNQIKGWEPVPEFTDSSNVHWVLAKAASDSTRDIPDPKTVQFVGAWNHEHLMKFKSQKIYVYAVEAVRPPRVGTEQPAMLLYQWFSTVKADFNPSMITPNEWLKANVYAAPLQDTRMSKLMAICKVQQPSPEQAQAVQNEDRPIVVEEISNGGSGNLQGNKGKGREGR